MRYSVAAALLALTQFPGPAGAGQAKPVSCLSQEDRTEITDLMARYALYADAGNGEAFASTFIDDGALIIRDQPVQGHRSLAEMIDRKQDRTLHLPSAPVLVKVADDRVRARSQLVYMKEVSPDGGGDSGSGANPYVGFAVYEDVIVRTSAGWKFQQRRAAETQPIAPEFLAPSPPPACRKHR